MNWERALQAESNVRFDRLINRWQELRGERKALAGWQHDVAREKVEHRNSGSAPFLGSKKSPSRWNNS
jgi:hypothetical protein